MNGQQPTVPVKTGTLVTGGLRRPSWICRNVNQRAVLVRDRSSSMDGQKAQDASEASLALVRELAQPVNKDGFHVAVVDFDDTAEVIHDFGKATALQSKLRSIAIGGSTNITAGLEAGLDRLETAEVGQDEEVRFLRPVFVVFSDGEHNTGPEPDDVADRIKLKADLVTVAFGSDADDGLLRRLASTPQHFYRVRDGRELRAFFAAVGATMTATRAAGTNATQALADIQQ